MKRTPTSGLRNYIPAVLFLTFAASAQVPIYRTTVIERTTQAVNYQYCAGPTAVDFRGTVLMPEAKGQATVESKRGRTEIDIKVDNLVAPTRFGHEYLTYTLWAITPEGAPRNIGEIIPNGSNKVRMRVTTDLQAFGMIVTAEPYSAARHPSDVVVLENQVRPDTIGRIQQIQAKYELMPRGHYTWDVANARQPDADGRPKLSMDRYEAVLQLYEAQNAIGIARANDAGRYAPESFAKAGEQLAEAERMQGSKAAASAIVQVARAAAQSAEDARAIAERRRQEDKLAVAQADAAKSQQARSRAEGDAQRARIEADSARADASAARSAQEQAEAAAADANGRLSQQPAAVVASALPLASTALQHAEAAKTELRKRLLAELDGVWLTSDTPRGLVITVPDSSFTGPELRGTVANRVGRATAVLSRYPGLGIEVEGHSDSAGTQPEASRRAESVLQALVANGLAPGRAAVRGLGDSRPLVSNATAEGRERNRRVEIVISGDSIGTLPVWDRTYSLTQLQAR